MIYKYFYFVLIVSNIDFRQPSDVEEVSEEAIVDSESKENVGGGWWDSLYSAAKSKVRYLFLFYYFIFNNIVKIKFNLINHKLF